MILKTNVTQAMVLDVQESMMKNRRSRIFLELEKDYFRRILISCLLIFASGLVLLLTGGFPYFAYTALFVSVSVTLLFTFLFLSKRVSTVVWILNKSTFKKQVNLSNGGLIEFERSYKFEADAITVISQSGQTKFKLESVDYIDETPFCDLYFVLGEPKAMVFTNFSDSDLKLYEEYKNNIIKIFSIKLFKI